ncbi:hypothetical protein IWQ61_004166, partial [Dispira simplex]
MSTTNAPVCTFEETVFEAIDRLYTARRTPYIHVQSIRTYIQCQREETQGPVDPNWWKRMAYRLREMVDEGKLEKAPHSPAYRLTGRVRRLLRTEKSYSYRQRRSRRSLVEPELRRRTPGGVEQNRGQRRQTRASGRLSPTVTMPCPETPGPSTATDNLFLNDTHGLPTPSSVDRTVYRRVAYLATPQARCTPLPTTPASRPTNDADREPILESPMESMTPSPLNSYLERTSTARRRTPLRKSLESNVHRDSPLVQHHRYRADEAERKQKELLQDKERVERLARRTLQRLESEAAAAERSHMMKQTALEQEVTQLRDQLRRMASELQSPPVTDQRTKLSTTSKHCDSPYHPPTPPSVNFTTDHYPTRFVLHQPPALSPFASDDDDEGHFMVDDLDDTFMHISREEDHSSRPSLTNHDLLNRLTPPPSQMLPDNLTQTDHPSEPTVPQVPSREQDLTLPRSLSLVQSPSRSRVSDSFQIVEFSGSKGITPMPFETAVENLRQMVQVEQKRTQQCLSSLTTDYSTKPQAITDCHKRYLHHLELMEPILQAFSKGLEQSVYRDVSDLIDPLHQLLDYLTTERTGILTQWQRSMCQPTKVIQTRWISPAREAEGTLTKDTLPERALDQLRDCLFATNDNKRDSLLPDSSRLPLVERWGYYLKAVKLTQHLRQLAESRVSELQSQLTTALDRESTLQEQLNNKEQQLAEAHTNHTAQLDKLREQHLEIESQLTKQHQSALEHIQQYHSHRTSELHDQLDKGTRALRDVTTQRDRLQQELITSSNDYEAQLQDVRERQITHEIRAREDRGQLTNDLTETRLDLEQSRAKVTQLNGKLNEYRTTQEALAAKLDELQVIHTAETAQWSNKLDQRDQQIECLETELEQARTNKRTLESAHDTQQWEMKQQILELRGQLAQSGQEKLALMERYQEEILGLQLELQTSEAKGMFSNLETVVRQIDSLDRQRAKLLDSYHTTERAWSDQRQEL